MRLRLGLVTVLSGALLVAAGCGSDEEGAVDTDTDTTPTTTMPSGSALLGSVGPGFEIELTAQDGAPVATLAAGTYRLEVDDRSSIHNFRLVGPGVNVATGVGDEGPQTFEVTLEPGSYEFLCDPHASTMRGSFEVSS